MTSILDEEFVTIAEAARLLRVSPSTIRRWVAEGDLPAYGVGRRGVRVRKPDVAGLITQRGPRGNGSPGGHPRVPPLTVDEQKRAVAAVEEAGRFQAEMLERRGGQPFSPSWILLDEARDERTRDLQ